MKRIIKKFVAVAAIVSTLFSLASCGNGITIDKEVTLSEVNSDYKTVAQAYLQAVFTQDADMFYACYPFEVQYMFEGNAEQYFANFKNQVADYDNYYGVNFKASNDYIKEDEYDEDTMRANIAEMHEVDASRIKNMVLVKDRVFFKDGKHYTSSDVYLLVYELEVYVYPEIDFETIEEDELYNLPKPVATGETAWYLYEIANSDSQFYDN